MAINSLFIGRTQFSPSRRFADIRESWLQVLPQQIQPMPAEMFFFRFGERTVEEIRRMPDDVFQRQLDVVPV